MRVVIVRTMPNFSMGVYADGIVSGLNAIHPDWEVVELTPHPVDRHSHSPLLRLKKYYERFWRFPRLVKHQKADIFHIIDHSEAHITRWIKSINKPVVVTCHDLINIFYKDNLQGSVKLPFVSHALWMKSVKAMKQADHVITVSSTTAQHTQEILDVESERISVVPNAVDSNFRVLSEPQVQSFRQHLGATSGSLCLLNVGSNHPRKNVSVIFAAVKLLKDKGASVQFWKAGTDFTTDERKLIAMHSIENEVSYIGQPEKSTLVKIYNAADVLVAPSLHEGFGITLLEAMACGTPVVTSNVSAMPEVVGDAGVLVDPTNARHIADAVLKIQSDASFRRQLVEKSLARAKTFTWEKTAKEISKVYEQVTEEMENSKASI